MAALIGATVTASSSLQDGETNLLEGAIFYVFLAIAFWYHQNYDHSPNASFFRE